MDLFSLHRPNTYTVSSLTEYIAAMIRDDDALREVWIEGEISNYRPSNSGHHYFTLKDGECQLACAMFKRAAMMLSTKLREGDSVIAFGRVEVYGARGQYQLIVERVRPVGLGDLFAKLEETRLRLSEEGLFALEKKRPLPPMPGAIGIVTSPDAAALQDALTVLRRRWPLARVVLSPTLVQGETAPPQIVRALDRLNARDDLDVILICRGGGSIEDLWAFNDERVVRAVAASRLPTVCGVGHETDTTLVDYAADVRAPTPSAAAELLTPDRDDVLRSVLEASALLDHYLTTRLNAQRDGLNALERALDRSSPRAQIERGRQRIDDVFDRMRAAQRARFALERERVAGRAAALASADPRALLGRGYALITDLAGHAVTRATGTRPGQPLTLHLKDGTIAARVEDVTLHDA
jgi:exodeoxyribonuclease VII large subunit